MLKWISAGIFISLCAFCLSLAILNWGGSIDTPDSTEGWLWTCIALVYAKWALEEIFPSDTEDGEAH